MTTSTEQGKKPAPVTMLTGYGPYSVCPQCHKQIHFVKTTKGKQMPCEMELRRGNGKMTLVTHAGVMVRKAGIEVVGWEPHWGYCSGFNGLFATGLQKMIRRGYERG